MPKETRVAPKPRYVIANPRGIPTGRHILRTGKRTWYEGDAYDGPVTERLVDGGFIVESKEKQA